MGGGIGRGCRRECVRILIHRSLIKGGLQSRPPFDASRVEIDESLSERERNRGTLARIVAEDTRSHRVPASTVELEEGAESAMNGDSDNQPYDEPHTRTIDRTRTSALATGFCRTQGKE